MVPPPPLVPVRCSAPQSVNSLYDDASANGSKTPSLGAGTASTARSARTPAAIHGS